MSQDCKLIVQNGRMVAPPMNKDPNITNHILQPSNSKVYGKVPRYNESHFASPSALRYAGLHCILFNMQKLLSVIL